VAEWQLRAILAGLLIAAGAAKADEPAAAYAYSLPITVKTAAANQLLTLPASVYEQARHSGPRDLAVWDADGKAVPSALCPPAAPRDGAERLIDLPLYPLQTPAPAAANTAGTASLSQSSDGTTISRTITLQALPAAGETMPRIGAYLLDLRDLPEPAIALLVDWQRQDGGSELDLELAQSADLQNWAPLARTRLVQAESEGKSLAARRIGFSAGQQAFLRISSQTALSRLQLRAVLSPIPAPVALRWFTASPGPLSPADGGLRIDYRSQPAAPVQAARITLPGGIRTLDVRLLAIQAGGAPSGELWRGLLHSSEGQADESPQWLPQSSSHVRLDIPRGGQTLSQPPQLELGYQPARLAFAAQGRGPWRLVYGAAQLPDAEHWQCGELIAGAAIAEIDGAPQVLAGEEALRPAGKPRLPRHWGLWALLLLGAAAVIGMAWQTLRERR